LSRFTRSSAWLAILAVFVVVAAAAEGEPARRLRLQLELAQGSGAWWQKALPGEDFDGVLLSWGLALLDGEERVVALPPQPACPADPSCLEWAASGTKCVSFIAQGLPEWDSHYSCYADGRTVFVEAPETLTELEIPEGVREARLTLYYRSEDFRRKPWPARAGDGPTAIRLRLDPDDGFSLDVRLSVELGPLGAPSDLRILSCQPRGGDATVVAARMRSPEFRYCEVVEVSR
jgi:hypothetical protein